MGAEMRVLDLFSGIGGFSLGLERAGMTTVAFCEIEPYCRKVLAKHWPHVPIYEDVRELNAERLNADGIAVDVICGGFPCQPFSLAGKRMGAKDDRHLWPEYFRLIKELRPAWVLGENVVGLINLGLDAVLDDLEAVGYSARTFDIPACGVGAPHIRRRLWIVAHPADDSGERFGQHGGTLLPKEKAVRPGGGCGVMADHESIGREGYGESTTRKRTGGGIPTGQSITGGDFGAGSGRGPWEFEPNVGRVAHGVPNRAYRLKALGNAVVPQIPELIGRAIMRAI